MNTFSFSFDHQIYYSNKNKVPIKEIAKGLLAAEDLLDELKPSIKAMFPDAKIHEINIYLDKLESGSIIEDLIIDVVFKGQDGYDKFREKICQFRKGGQKNDDEDNETMKQIMGLTLAAAIGFGANYALSSDKAPIPQSITNHNVAINNTVIGDGKESLSGADIVEIIRANSDHNKVAKASVNMVKPAKEDKQASIIINGNEDLAITPEVIKAVPEKFTPPMPQETVEYYKEIEIKIKASDAEKHRSGWAGTVTGLVDERKKFIVSDDIKPSELHGKLKVTADIAIIKKFNDVKKEYKIHEILINKIY